MINETEWIIMNSAQLIPAKITKFGLSRIKFICRINEIKSGLAQWIDFINENGK